MKDNYDDFNVGDTYVLKKKYSKKDFEAFSRLSGDTNPLHFSEDYAKKTSFNSTIVPLHLAASPLSAIAGRVFPGHRSLYISHELNAINPIPYNTELTYSAKIIDKNPRDRVLTVRTIIFHDQKVFVEATQKIKVRDDDILACSIPGDSNESGFQSNDNAVLITGALGEVGQRIALNLAKNGYKLVLCVRQINDKALNLATKLEAYDTVVEFLELDLSKIERKKLDNLTLNVGIIIHAASPPVFSSLAEHMAVSFEALLHFFDKFRYEWLCQQYGRIIFISSLATQYHPQGWENYIAAKTATDNYLKGIHQSYSNYGIGVNVLSPSLVDTAFSSKLGLETSPALLPEQVADEVLSILENPTHFYTWLEVNSKREGNTGFIENKPSTTAVYQGGLNQKNYLENSQDANLLKQFKIFFTSFFSLPENVDWNNTGINLTAGWDSLRHMELLMNIESEFNISITSEEIDKTRTFMTIYNLLKSKNLT
jgi:3-oxoacyl-[acyl-carrier protein] reductase